MMMSEFIERTGFEPTAEEYAKIEHAYYDFDGEKNDFCKAFVAERGESRLYRERAKEIERLKSELMETMKQMNAEIAARDRRIEELQDGLDRELEWKPSETAGTNMKQRRYEVLAEAGRKLSDEEARALIAEEFGFDQGKVEIKHEASSYDVNKYGRNRVSAVYDRDPVYESTDWNYVRFDCGDYMYEMINGELQFYCR